jgi:hypothetical protein
MFRLAGARYRETFTILFENAGEDDRGGRIRHYGPIPNLGPVRGVLVSVQPPKEAIQNDQMRDHRYVKITLNRLDVGVVKGDYRVRDRDGQDWDIMSQVQTGNDVIVLCQDVVKQINET